MGNIGEEVKSDMFSVIVLCYNNAELLYECLDSIISQKYPSIEIIVADDKSKVFDGNKIVDYINTKKTDFVKSVLVYQNESNLGTVKNINRALEKANGRYIKIIAADDKLYDENVFTQSSIALNNSRDGIITGEVMKCDQNMLNPVRYETRLIEKLNNLNSIQIFKKLCVHNGIVAGGVFFEKRFFEKYGMFDESYRLMEDWPMWLKVTKEGCKIEYHNFYAVMYRANGGIGTGINPLYMADKKRVLNDIIKPSKKIMGVFTYLKARISFAIINSMFVRKLYGKLFRKGK